ncbi:7926_t:CDS:2 [Funneliformis caledonium]|uniref:7926_t:CDS:1 n=1 Tax=Funneliformis caledonium TaxID=1117310 RepID=A0A9N8Z181_9GLOM|nr:7926_t:CDS:2 [Funneliformis caledonium]
MNFNAHESELLKNTKKLIQETLPKFLKAFSLEGSNPLRDITFFEKSHLNQFVYPIIDSALWIFAKINYIYREIPLKDLEFKIRTNGVGFLNDVVNYLIVCGSMAALYNNIIIEEADAR